METERSSPNAVLDGFDGLVAREEVEPRFTVFSFSFFLQ